MSTFEYNLTLYILIAVTILMSYPLAITSLMTWIKSELKEEGYIDGVVRNRRQTDPAPYVYKALYLGAFIPGVNLILMLLVTAFNVARWFRNKIIIRTFREIRTDIYDIRKGFKPIRVMEDD